ncbi:unnamed protein product [Rotaria sp. Silwood2]|nr:unnamed protein product [Rotaria sp. Silwood2]CAF2784237.1 unnamed protein product [Rotaria sp. Silwood2]CAF3870672.1 unnamed protein product [Rotaria sp. Silwood2]CAF3891901.1 unnamed protein product [Rotaria sp. Silwood2]
MLISTAFGNAGTKANQIPSAAYLNNDNPNLVVSGNQANQYQEAGDNTKADNRLHLKNDIDDEKIYPIYEVLIMLICVSIHHSYHSKNKYLP